ncbi:MAG: YraN family protein [Methylocystis sp.]|uniref:YraN family protein n=1 Tax=Methylocystis sp. TaxID=1911079 RepID=UPI003DA5EEB2
MEHRDENARRAAHAWGLKAETIAALWLRARLYTILDRNYRVKGGEIDIVARRGETIAFVEVKARGSLEDAAIAITPQKQRRISRAANRWLATHPWAASCAWRGDALLIAPGKLPRHLENAFELSVG